MSAWPQMRKLFFFVAFLMSGGTQSADNVGYVGYYYGSHTVPTLQAAEANVVQVNAGLVNDYLLPGSPYQNSLPQILASIKWKNQSVVFSNLWELVYTSSRSCVLRGDYLTRLSALQTILQSPTVAGVSVVALDILDEPYHPAASWTSCGSTPSVAAISAMLGDISQKVTLHVPSLSQTPRMLVTDYTVVAPGTGVPDFYDLVGVNIYNHRASLDAAKASISPRQALTVLSQIASDRPSQKPLSIVLISQAADKIDGITLSPEMLADIIQEYMDAARTNPYVIGVLAFGGWDWKYAGFRGIRSNCQLDPPSYFDHGGNLAACEQWADRLRRGRDVMESALASARSSTEIYDFRGAYDGVQFDSGTGRYFVAGWACTYGENTQVKVDIYFSSGTTLNVADRVVQHVDAAGQVNASVSSACGTTGLGHRFRVDVTPWISDEFVGRRVYVVPKFGLSQGVPIGNSGLTTAPYSVPARVGSSNDPIGVFDGVMLGSAGAGGYVWQIGGWACVFGQTEVMTVDVYMKGELGLYLIAEEVQANGYPSAAVDNACGTPGANIGRRFYINVSNHFSNVPIPQKKIYVVARRSNSGSASFVYRSKLIDNSGSSATQYLAKCVPAGPGVSGTGCN